MIPRTYCPLCHRFAPTFLTPGDPQLRYADHLDREVNAVSGCANGGRPVLPLAVIACEEVRR